MEEKLREYLEHQRHNQTRVLPLPSLQFFGVSEGGGDEGGGAGEGEGAGTGEGDGNGEGAGDEGGANRGTEVKTFTQEDVNAIATRESRKAVEKALRELGVKDIKSAKEGLEQLKQMQQEQMTEQQKIEARKIELEELTGTQTTTIDDLQAQLAALKSDVDPESVGDVVVLAKNLVSDEVTIEAAMKQVVEKYPHFKRQADTNNNDDGGQDDKKTKKPNFTHGNHNADKKETQQEAWANAFKF